MMLENVNYIDDDHLDVRNFVKAMKQSKHVPKSACPSPEAFAEKFRKAKNVFCTTISSHLSGCYNSAMLAKEMVEQEGGHRVHIFDSWSATAGEIAICIKIKECIEAHMDYDAVVEKVTEFRNGMRTVKAKLFCPEIAGLFCRIAGLFCHDSRANLSLKPVCFGIAIS